VRRGTRTLSLNGRGITSSSIAVQETINATYQGRTLNQINVTPATRKNAMEPSIVFGDPGQCILPNLRPMSAAAASPSINIERDAQTI